MRINRLNVGAIALSGVLAACGQAEEGEFAESTADTAQALTSAPRANVPPSFLDIAPPAFALASSNAKSAGAGTDAAYVEAARAFAAANAARYGLAAGASSLQPLSVKRSLLGVHVTLQEQINGFNVEASTFTVSFELGSGNVYQVHSAVVPHQPPALVKVNLTQDAAYDASWRRLGVSGEVLSPPNATLTYVLDPAAPGRLRLVHRVNLNVSAPRGDWQVDVDATTGSVVSVSNMILPRTKNATQVPAAPAGPLADRGTAFSRAMGREAELSGSGVAAKSLVNATGKAFDPDPMTTLVSTSLSDASAASAFTAAYQTVTLQQVTFDLGVYKLVGPWVQIVNFEAPNTAPSTTLNGNWTSLRGNNAFNDVMTYFHIDKTQRYIQSLGFSNIQALPIQADSDGFNGTDNSYFDPSSNRIAFGHGGVDDNEDADVILHEYGHAINKGINNSWDQSLGDMGAMGEGFGDYWAASSNIDTFPTGFDNLKVFTWDANAVDNFWAGRRLDRTGLLYNPSLSYGSHQSLPGGGVSDELWSTPLFQALLALRTAGVPKAQVDKIVLEAQFGLGAPLTMRQMATAIVATAKKLYPMGPHAGMISTKFFAQNILLAADWSLFAALFVATL